MEMNAVVRKWRHSLVIILPKELVQQQNIKINDSIQLSIRKEVNLSRFFGAFKTTKTAQQLKDESREGWM